MKNADFWNVTPRGSFKTRPFGGTCRLHLQGRITRAIIFLHSIALTDSVMLTLCIFYQVRTECLSIPEINSCFSCLNVNCKEPN
jgi:hypothetical protein